MKIIGMLLLVVFIFVGIVYAANNKEPHKKGISTCSQLVRQPVRQKTGTATKIFMLSTTGVMVTRTIKTYTTISLEHYTTFTKAAKCCHDTGQGM